MPRPSHQTGNSNAGGASQSRFPFSKIIRDRKMRREQKQEQAAKAITNNRAENENMIIDVISGINFVRSEIPQEILNHKSDPNQPWGDLEYAARAIQKMLRDSPNFTVNTALVDEKLLQLANEFKNAVAVGNVKAAFAAKGALLTCLSKIRNRIPNVSPELVEGFIERGGEYINTWILLVDNSRVADELEENVKTEKLKYDANVAEENDAEEALKKRIKENDDFLEAFYQISERTAPTDPTKWSEAMRTVRKAMVDQMFSKANLGLTFRILQGQEIKLKKQEGKIDTLSAKVAAIPIPEDPNSDNKYNEEVNAIFEELASIDTEIDELLTTIEDIEGRMQSLDEAPGSVHLRNTIAQQAEDFIKNIQEEQEKEIASQGVNREKLMKKLNIRSEEEQQEMIKQAENERLRLIESVMNENPVYEEETQSQQLYIEN